MSARQSVRREVVASTATEVLPGSVGGQVGLVQSQTDSRFVLRFRSVELPDRRPLVRPPPLLTGSESPSWSGQASGRKSELLRLCPCKPSKFYTLLSDAVRRWQRRCR